MPDNKVTRKIKIVTEQQIIDKPSGVEGYPQRSWSIQIFLLGANDEELPANIFDKAKYMLHPSFPVPEHTLKKPPFHLKQEGWGEFDMQIILTAIDRGGDHTITHDLNFRSPRYEAFHTVTFKNPKPALAAALAESGPMENGIKKKGDESAKKKKRADRGVDMEKLADNLQRLTEDDLLQVVQLIHDNKSPETYTKNDVEQGEFHVDLYTLPDSLVRQLWDFTQEKL
ncbi:transcription initiation factor TFIID subunit 14 [Physcia stellaris]|nr:transcription initiation factor TFIID subunit 14 [Physcia stellaris]